MRKIEFMEKAKELKELQAMKEEIENEIEKVQQVLKRAMELDGKEEIICGMYKIRYTTVSSKRFDTTAFKEKYQTLYEQFTKPIFTKRFSVV